VFRILLNEFWVNKKIKYQSDILTVVLRRADHSNTFDRLLYDTMELDRHLGDGKAGLASIKAILMR
jgi:hypothetical protein